jgi:hypothetical protein
VRTELPPPAKIVIHSVHDETTAQRLTTMTFTSTQIISTTTTISDPRDIVASVAALVAASSMPASGLSGDADSGAVSKSSSQHKEEKKVKGQGSVSSSMAAVVPPGATATIMTSDVPVPVVKLLKPEASVGNAGFAIETTNTELPSSTFTGMAKILRIEDTTRVSAGIVPGTIFQPAPVTQSVPNMNGPSQPAVESPSLDPTPKLTQESLPGTPGPQISDLRLLASASTDASQPTFPATSATVADVDVGEVKAAVPQPNLGLNTTSSGFRTLLRQ